MKTVDLNRSEYQKSYINFRKYIYTILNKTISVNNWNILNQLPLTSKSDFYKTCITLSHVTAKDSSIAGRVDGVMIAEVLG